MKRTLVLAAAAALLPLLGLSCRSVDSAEPVRGDMIYLMEGATDHSFNQYTVGASSNPRSEVELNTYLVDPTPDAVTSSDISNVVKFSSAWHNERELRHSAFLLVADQDPSKTAWVLSTEPLVVAIGTRPKPPTAAQSPYVQLPTAADLNERATRVVVTDWFTAPFQTAASARKTLIHEPRRILDIPTAPTLAELRASHPWLQ
jgi:hypothetical protein